MANSDNVVRAGLTNKYKDIPTLLDILDYNSYKIDELVIQPIIENNHNKVLIYPNKTSEFSINNYYLLTGKNCLINNENKLTIIIVIFGKGEIKLINEQKTINYNIGSIFYMEDNYKININALEDSNIYIAYSS